MMDGAAEAVERCRGYCFILALALCGCAGTEMHASGSACGGPFDITLTDRKDRSGFSGTITCPDGGAIAITSTDSSTSAVIAQQAAMLGKLTDLVAALAASAATGTPGLSWRQENARRAAAMPDVLPVPAMDKSR